MAINIELLNILDAVDRRGTFAKAAEELNKSTAAISQAITRQESQLGITIFQRVGRNSVLTAAGELLLEDGRDILTALNQIEAKVKRRATGWESEIKIGIESTAELDPIMKATNRFLARNAEINVHFTQTVLNGGWEALERGDIDLLIDAPGPLPRHRGIRGQRVPGSRMLLVASAQHPINEFLGTAQLAEEINNTRVVVLHDSAKETIKRTVGLGFTRKAIYVDTQEQKVAAIRQATGIGHLPEHLVREDIKRGRMIRLGNAVDQLEHWYIAWRTNHTGKAAMGLAENILAIKGQHDP